MCSTLNPHIPNGMGPIQFPSDGNLGSGDVIIPPKPRKSKNKKTIKKQESAHKILSFDEFFSK